MPWVCPLSSNAPLLASHQTHSSATVSANRLVESTATGSRSER